MRSKQIQRFLRNMSQCVDVCNPSNVTFKRSIFAGILTRIPRISHIRQKRAMDGRPRPPPTRARGQDDVSYSKLPQNNNGYM